MSVLSNDDAWELTSRLVESAKCAGSLVPGLRAAAHETARSNVKRELLEMADRLENGAAFTDVIGERADVMPRHFRGLLLAGIRTGHLVEVLADLIDVQQTRKALRRTLSSELTYPIIITTISLLVVFAALQLSRQFEVLFQDFALRIPDLTAFLFWVRDYGSLLLLIGAIVGFVAAVLLRWSIGQARWARLVSFFPLVGPLFYWLGVSEWAGITSVLLRYQVPLPETLELSALGTSNEHVAMLSRRWADETAQGKRITDVLMAHRDFPRGLTPLVRWGEERGELADSFATVRQGLERRVQMYANLIQTLTSPILFTCIAGALLLIVLGLFAPLVNLLNALSQ